MHQPPSSKQRENAFPRVNAARCRPDAAARPSPVPCRLLKEVSPVIMSLLITAGRRTVLFVHQIPVENSPYHDIHAQFSCCPFHHAAVPFVFCQQFRRAHASAAACPSATLHVLPAACRSLPPATDSRWYKREEIRRYVEKA